ncbi:MAG: acyl-homoserine-lactone synthase [Steroidobacter sp.]
MVYLINAGNRWMFETDLAQMHRQRKVVFVDVAGWNVPVVGDMEIDQYDGDEAIYLLSKSDACRDEVLASVRLLPTIRPHLMSDLFVASCSGDVPRGPSIWEVSRFCISPAVTRRSRRLALLWEMTCAVMETALLFGVERVTFVANAALAPLMLDCGWQAGALGPTLRDGDDEITAIAASVTPAGLRTVRCRFGVPGPVTRFPAPAVRIAA